GVRGGGGVSVRLRATRPRITKNTVAPAAVSNARRPQPRAAQGKPFSGTGAVVVGGFSVTTGDAPPAPDAAAAPAAPVVAGGFLGTTGLSSSAIASSSLHSERWVGRVSVQSVGEAHSIFAMGSLLRPATSSMRG